jgi:hypothetical protein
MLVLISKFREINNYTIILLLNQIHRCSLKQQFYIDLNMEKLFNLKLLFNSHINRFNFPEEMNE